MIGYTKVSRFGAQLQLCNRTQTSGGSMNVEKRMEIERRVVRHLIRSMKAAGWRVFEVDDGDVTKVSTENEAMEALFAVDEAHIFFLKETRAGTLRRTAYIVLGNDGWDCICDHSRSNAGIAEDDFEKVMEEVVNPYCDKICLEEC